MKTEVVPGKSLHEITGAAAENSRRRHAFLVPVAALLLALLQCRATSQPSARALETAVADHAGEFYAEPVHFHADSNGVVIVEGEVGTLFDKLKIGEVISELAGVKRIDNRITVTNILTVDGEIEANIKRELERNDAILEPEKIHVEVQRGVVLLSGTVNFYREKLLAQSIASWQDGVSDMKSTLDVLSPRVERSDSNLTRIVGDLLERSYPVEKGITCTVHNADVTLAGTVRTLFVRNHLEEDVRRVLGVQSVHNALELRTQE
jgi:osmotically-inducible protein OsmY